MLSKVNSYLLNIICVLAIGLTTISVVEHSLKQNNSYENIKCFTPIDKPSMIDKEKVINSHQILLSRGNHNE